MKKYLRFVISGIVLIAFILGGILIDFNHSRAEDEVVDNSYTVSYIYVDIKGAIKNPSVYRVTGGTRLFQLIEIAGGLTSDCDTKNINLSKKLNDEESIYIPFLGDEISSIGENLVNINTATKDELDSLPGIGAVTAQAIIDYRTNIGVFKKIEDIMNVSGIGESSFEKIKDYITV